jgi:hypothetical protein
LIGLIRSGPALRALGPLPARLEPASKRLEALGKTLFLSRQPPRGIGGVAVSRDARRIVSEPALGFGQLLRLEPRVIHRARLPVWSAIAKLLLQVSQRLGGSRALLSRAFEILAAETAGSFSHSLRRIARA